MQWSAYTYINPYVNKDETSIISKKDFSKSLAKIKITLLSF
jgi:hypothetical protein